MLQYFVPPSLPNRTDNLKLEFALPDFHDITLQS